MTNDARSKLRSMGGIMASSPELMQVVQKFQLGGPVAPQPPMAGRLPFMPRPIRGPMSLNRSLNDPGPTPIIEPPLAGTIPVVPRDVSLRGDIMNSPELRNQLLSKSTPAFGTSQTIGSVDRTPPSDVIMDLVESSESSTAKALEIESMRKKGTQAAADFVMGLPDPAQALSKYAAIFGAELAGSIASLLGSTETGAKFFDIADVNRRASVSLPLDRETAETPMGGPRRGSAGPTRSVIDRNVESLEGPEATGLGGQMRPTQEMIDEDIVMSQGIPRQALGLSEDDEAIPPMITDDPEGTADEALSSLDKSYEEKLALFNKVLGGSDEQDSKDKAMSLAMIGLAIAAGQSPNALTNIAQGLMVGAKGIGAQRKERQAKREKTKLLAFDAALREQDAQQKFERELRLKEADVSDYSDKTKDIDTPLGKLTVALPTASAAAKGVEPQLLTGSDLERQFKTKVEEKNRFMGMAQEAIDILDKPGDTVAGIGGATLRTLQSFKNAGAIPDAMYERITGLAEGEISDATRFDVIMTNMAAQLAPMLLGESGRTISDGDRARVADQLGVSYDPASVNDGIPGLTITGFGSVATKGEGGLKERLTRIQGLLDSAYQPVFDTYKQYNPVGYNDYIKSLEEAKPSKANVRKFDAQGNPIQ